MKHQIYGLCMQSDIPFPQLYDQPDGEPDVAFQLADSLCWERIGVAQNAGGINASFGAFRSSSHYVLRWPEFFDFSVSLDGGTITCRLNPGVPRDVIRLALFGRILSLALHLKGIPNLHGSAVVDRDTAVAFVAPGGSGKSTFAAFCALTGYPLLSEEVLALREESSRIYVSPGYSQVRLSREAFDWLALQTTHSINTEHDREKLRMYLGEASFCIDPQPLSAIYLLAPYTHGSGARVWASQVPHQEALPELLEDTLNLELMDQAMLARQLAFLCRLVAQVPVKRLHYPRSFAILPQVRDLVLNGAGLGGE